MVTACPFPSLIGQMGSWRRFTDYSSAFPHRFLAQALSLARRSFGQLFCAFLENLTTTGASTQGAPDRRFGLRLRLLREKPRLHGKCSGKVGPVKRMSLPGRLSAEPEQPMAAITKTRFAPQSKSKMQSLCNQQTVGSGESGKKPLALPHCLRPYATCANPGKERRNATLGQLLTKHSARCAALNQGDRQVCRINSRMRR